MSVPNVCPTCGVVLAQGMPGCQAKADPAPAAKAVDSTDGLDPVSVSLATAEPDPLLHTGTTPAPDPEPEDGPEHRPSWPVVLLGSYASALTLACGWLLWERPREHDLPAPGSPAVDDRPDPGLRADRSRRVAGPPPIPAAEPQATRNRKAEYRHL